MDAQPSWPRGGTRAGCWAALLATFLIRALHAGQPIVENYVGRQVPTAMVARNLDRGTGLLRPQLDTAPFPNYFLVEPPIYESGVVVLKRATGLSLEEAGRILSALATAWRRWVFSCWHAGAKAPLAAYLAVAAFAVFPLTIRYGRAFQPDAAMMGAVVLGLACWDRHRSNPHWYWLAAAWFLVALGFALKITAAFLLVPLVLVIARARSPRAILTVCSTLLPALLWYAWATHLLGSGEGSRASADNRSIWLGLLGPAALLKPETLKFVGWFLFVRAFTPLGAGLALIGLWAYRARELTEAIATAMPCGWSGESRHWLPWRFSRRNCITSITGCCLLPSPRWGSAVALAWLAQTSPRRGGRRGGIARSCSRGFRSARRGGRPPNGMGWSRRPAPSRRRFRRTPGWSRRRLCCFRPIAAAAAWSGATRPRRERPASGKRDDRSTVRSNWSNTIAARGPGISPTWAAARPT